jgi:hypothetical protein
MLVRFDGAKPRSVACALADYPHIDHGYAATVHKAQGLTVDRAHVAVAPNFDRHTAYVALTRHRADVQLHYGCDDSLSPQYLGRALARGRVNDIASEAIEAERCNKALARSSPAGGGKTRAQVPSAQVEKTAQQTPKRAHTQVEGPHHKFIPPRCGRVTRPAASALRLTRPTAAIYRRRNLSPLLRL